MELRAPKLLEALIVAECLRRGSVPGNRLGVSLYRPVRTLSFLAICADDYASAAEHDLDLQQQWQEQLQPGPPGQRPLTEAEVALWADATYSATVLHLRIETFYLWAKILLDQTAMAVERFFGPARGLSIQKHSTMMTKHSSYLSAKGLPPFSQSLALALTDVDSKIIRFRDHVVVHESPRTVKSAIYSFDDREAAITAGWLPSWSGQTDNVTSEPPPALLAALDSYVAEVAEYLERNHAAASTGARTGARATVGGGEQSS